MLRVGLVSDTHGLLRPEAVEFLRGCDRIIHGGDIGGEAIVRELAAIAPLTAVRGNNDKDAWARDLPQTEFIALGDVFAHVIHDLAELDLDPVAADVHVVVSGHTHKPVVEHRHGVLFVNPGSAGPRRFKLPVAVAELLVEGGAVSARIVELI